MILLTLLPVLIELAFDIYAFKTKGRVNHKNGVYFRLAVCLLLGLINWQLIGLYLAWHILVFDHVIGYVVAGNILHIGDTAKTGRFILNNKYLRNANVRTFIRIFLGSILSSFYFYTEQWIGLWIN